MGLRLLISLPSLINSPLICTPLPSGAGRAWPMGPGRGEGGAAPAMYCPGCRGRRGQIGLSSQQGQGLQPRWLFPSWSSPGRAEERAEVFCYSFHFGPAWGVLPAVFAVLYSFSHGAWHTANPTPTLTCCVTLTSLFPGPSFPPPRKEWQVSSHGNEEWRYCREGSVKDVGIGAPG